MIENQTRVPFNAETLKKRLPTFHWRNNALYSSHPGPQFTLESDHLTIFIELTLNEPLIFTR